MNTIKTFIPSESVEAFKKFADKTQKNVNGFAYTLGKPYEKLFQHHIIDENGMSGGVSRVFHEVCNLVINMPDESDWRLIATYMDGAFTPADPTKELIFKNPAHGEDYGKVERAIEAQLSKALINEHFHLEQLTSGLKYPNSIVEAVNQKNKAIQEAQRALNEVAVKKAEAEKMLVQARAEREANELKSATLTPAILKKMWIEKWDGKLPVYGNVPQIMMTK